MPRAATESVAAEGIPEITDPELRAKLTPDYQATCKRLIFCSEFYQAITQPNAHLVTEGIEAIEPAGACWQKEAASATLSRWW